MSEKRKPVEGSSDRDPASEERDAGSVRALRFPDREVGAPLKRPDRWVNFPSGPKHASTRPTSVSRPSSVSAMRGWCYFALGSSIDTSRVPFGSELAKSWKALSF